MPQVHHGPQVQFQTGEWITLFMVLFMLILIAGIITYYKYFAPRNESAWKSSKRKKTQ